MACGGYSRSVLGGLEPVYDFQCSPCEKDGKHVEALNACMECRQNQCPTCLGYHSRFEGMTSHTVLDKAGMFVPTEKCTIHQAKVVNMYCSEHDVVCCGVCIDINHRSCGGVVNVLHASQGIDSSKEVKVVKTGLQKIQKEVAKLKKTKHGDLARNGKEQLRRLEDIDAFRDDLVNHLDKMVMEAKDEVRAKHTGMENEIDTAIKALSEMDVTLTSNIKQLDTIQGQHEVQVFLYVKQGKGIETEGKKLMQELERSVGRETTNYLINSSIKEYVMNLKSICVNRPVSSATLHGQYDMQVKGDIQTCNVVDACLIKDRYTVLSDFNNNKLKLLDQTYTVVDSCPLPGGPCGICSTGPSEIAVVIRTPKQKIMQFVSIGDKLTLTRSFNVSIYCRYVAFSKGELFVTCSNIDSRVIPEVQVYSLTGNHLRTISNYKSGQLIFFNPFAIALNNDGTSIHVADENEVITMDRQGQEQTTFSDPSLKGAVGICVLENDNLLVSGSKCSNVIQIDSQGIKAGEIISWTDGLRGMKALCYDGVNSRLIVTQQGDEDIKVFDLIRK